MRNRENCTFQINHISPHWNNTYITTERKWKELQPQTCAPKTQNQSALSASIPLGASFLVEALGAAASCSRWAPTFRWLRICFILFVCSISERHTNAQLNKYWAGSEPCLATAPGMISKSNASRIIKLILNPQKTRLCELNTKNQSNPHSFKQLHFNAYTKAI